MLNLKSVSLLIMLIISSFSWAELPVSNAQSPNASNNESKQVVPPQEVGSSIDINQADVTQLATLSNIGVKKAQQIIAYRELHGQFGSIEDLQNVKGIGKATIEKNRARLMVAAQ